MNPRILRLTGEKSTLSSVLPIFKKGKKEGSSNYKPSSLTSVPGKILEKVILRVTEKHLRDNVVTASIGSRGKSCLAKVISFYAKVILLADQRKPVDVVSLDFSRAFNTVSKSIVDKLSSTQLSKSIIHWMNNWLTGWAQRVTVNEVISG